MIISNTSLFSGSPSHPISGWGETDKASHFRIPTEMEGARSITGETTAYAIVRNASCWGAFVSNQFCMKKA